MTAVNRRSFLQVMGLSVAAPSFLISEKTSPLRRENPDFITTGFPTIDEAIGGWKRGSFNVVGGLDSPHLSLLLKSHAIHAAADLNKRASVLYVSPTTNQASERTNPFDGLLVKSESYDLKSIAAYDLVVIDQPENSQSYPVWSRLSYVACETNTAIVIRIQNKKEYWWHYGTYFVSTTALSLNKSEKDGHTLNLVKNRYGHQGIKVELTRPSIHFFQEKP